MRVFPGLVVLLVACTSAFAEPGYSLFPAERPIEGTRERAVTLVKMPAIDALPLIWGDPEGFVSRIDRHLKEGSAKPLARLHTSTKPGDEFRAEIGGEVGFPKLLAEDRQFGQAPMIVTASQGAEFVGSRVFPIDGVTGGFEFEHDFRPPDRWVWQNGPFWGGGEFVFQHRVRFHLKSQTPPIGKSAFMGASDFIPPDGGDSVAEVCLLFARFSAVPGEDSAKEKSYIQIDTVTFATRDRATVGRFLLRTGSKTDRVLFDELSKDATSGKAEIRSLQSVLSRKGIYGKVDSIGSHAFRSCRSLSEIVIPDSVTSIGTSAFSGCTNLTSVTLPNSAISIGYAAFSGCGSLTDIVIPHGVTSIGSYAFSNCISLTEVILPDSVISIGSSAFAGCKLLTEMLIPDSAISIGNFAFVRCDSLTNVRVGRGVLSIGSGAFSGTAVPLQESGGLKYFTNSIRAFLVDASAATGDLILPAQFDGRPVQSVDAFLRNRNVTSVTVPNSVTSIGSAAFFGCESLTSVIIPDSVVSIGQSAFTDCASLASVSIGAGTTNIGPSAFKGCSDLTGMIVPESVTSIGSSAFEGCSSLMDVTIPDSVTSVGSSAFKDCISLARVNFNASVTSILERTFQGCSNLTSVFFPAGLTRICRLAFGDCSSLTTVLIPDGVTSIEYEAFYNCGSLATVILPASLDSIASRVFHNCSSLTSLIFLGARPRAVGGFVDIGAAGNPVFVMPEHIATFGGEGTIWLGMIVRPIPTVAEPLIGHVHSAGNSFTISFSGEALATDWRIMGSSDLDGFDDDLTTSSEITEITPSKYEVVIDVPGLPAPYFFRVER